MSVWTSIGRLNSKHQCQSHFQMKVYLLSLSSLCVTWHPEIAGWVGGWVGAELSDQASKRVGLSGSAHTAMQMVFVYLTIPIGLYCKGRGFKTCSQTFIRRSTLPGTAGEAELAKLALSDYAEKRKLCWPSLRRQIKHLLSVGVWQDPGLSGGD